MVSGYLSGQHNVSFGMSLEQLKYPIGRYRRPEHISPEDRQKAIDVIAAFPLRLGMAVEGLSEQQLDTPYRPEGWTIRQVVHHCADSHMNALVRFKLALTEDQPVIKPYLEARWAELHDTRHMDIAPSLLLLQGLHARWAELLRQLSAVELQRTFIHPEHGQVFTLDETVALYAWHSEHHLAHITRLKERNQWT